VLKIFFWPWPLYLNGLGLAEKKILKNSMMAN